MSGVGGVGSRAWTALVVVGLGGWIGAVVAVGAARDTPTDGSPSRTAFVVGGAIFFSLVFGAAAWQMRRTHRQSRSALFDRLAVLPVAPGEVERATRPMYTIGYVYVAFGAIVTALGLTAVAIGDDDGSSGVLGLMLAIVAVWAVFAVYALLRSYAGADAIVRPLGLELTEVPTYRTSWLADRSWMTGAISYGGSRHGRIVSISQAPKGAATVVAGTVGDGPVPRNRAEMSQLTGEPFGSWKGVTVRIEDGAVIVVREGNGAGGWFLHDLLLAEAVAGR